MASATETTTVMREVAIDASPETVWQFLVDPEKATRWMGMTATFDPRPGGIYRVEVIPGHTASGEPSGAPVRSRSTVAGSWSKQRRPRSGGLTGESMPRDATYLSYTLR